MMDETAVCREQRSLSDRFSGKSGVAHKPLKNLYSRKSDSSVAFPRHLSLGGAAPNRSRALFGALVILLGGGTKQR
jgi:hypothetical protein